MLKGSIFGFHIRRCNELRRIGKHQIMLLCGVGPDLALRPSLEACLFLLLQQSIWHPWRAVDVELIWKEWVFPSPSQLLLPWPNLAIWHLLDHLRSVFTPPVCFGAPQSYFLACCCIVYGTHAEPLCIYWRNAGGLSLPFPFTATNSSNVQCGVCLCQIWQLTLLEFRSAFKLPNSSKLVAALYRAFDPLSMKWKNGGSSSLPFTATNSSDFWLHDWGQIWHFDHL